MRYAADCFLVPDDRVLKLTDEQWTEKLEEYFRKKAGMSNEEYVQVWLAEGGQFQWPAFLPLKMLPQKEGEKVLLKIGEDEFELTAKRIKPHDPTEDKDSPFDAAIDMLFNANIKPIED